MLTARLTRRERWRLNRALIDLLKDRELAPIASLSDHSGYLIAQAHHLVRRRAAERLAPIGLDPRAFGVLNVLAHNRPCSQSRLAASLGVSPPAAFTFVDQLEANALVIRKRSTSDRRVYDVQLTEEGERRLRAARAVASEIDRDITARIGDREDDLRMAPPQAAHLAVLTTEVGSAGPGMGPSGLLARSGPPAHPGRFTQPPVVRDLPCRGAAHDERVLSRSGLTRWCRPPASRRPLCA